MALLGGLELVPGQRVNVPGVVNVDVGELEGDGADVLGQRRDEEVGPEREGCGDGSLEP